MKKTCATCNESKPVEQFHFKYTAKGVRHSRCSACFSEYRKDYYQKNRERFVAGIMRDKRRRVEANKLKVLEYLKTHPCVDCGEGELVVLEFDHVRGKKVRAISSLIYRASGWATIAIEIDKCEVRCANCHRRRTAKVRNWKYGLVM